MYTVTIFQSGKTIKVTDPIPAENALAAIAQVEKDYPASKMAMGDKVVSWNGLEFVARRVN